MGISVDLSVPEAFAAGAESSTAQNTSTGPTVSDAQSPQFDSLGPLLDEQDNARIVATLVGWIKEQGPARKRRRAEWECNKLWLRGVRGARVRRQSEDRNDVELVVPLGAYDLPPVMDRCDELLEKVVAHLLSDPPIPDAEPASDSDEDRDAAEFTTRLLRVEGSESGFNNLKLMRRAARKAGIYGSSFIYACLDPTGNGWRPTEIRALPTAQTEDDATIDPQTGQAVGDGDPRLTTRYVTQNGTLTDDKTQARPQWLPKIVPEILTGEQVVLLPESCSGIHDAKGVILIRYTPLAKLKNEFPELQQADDETIQKLVRWSPDDAKYARPGYPKQTELKPTTEDGKPSDSSMVCTLSLYFTSHGAYPKGAYIVAGGEDVVLYKKPWSGVVEPAPGQNDEEMLLLPLAQERHLDDDVEDDAFGKGLIAKIGPADEVRGSIVLSWLEYLDRFNHPIPFLPLGSIVQPNEMLRRDDTPVIFNPQGKPEWEQIVPFPPDAKEFFDRATDAQDSAVGLEETAQGAEAPNVTSGIQAQAVIQQAHVNLMTLRANLADCQERWWRICTQLIRVFYTIPQKLKYQSEDGAYREREWSRVDLGSTRDIRIARGSFTQQAPEQKQAKLDARLAAQLIDPEEHERLSNENIGASLGFQDNPHRLRIRRQLTLWKEGPKADFPAKAQQYAVAYQQWQMQSQQAAALGQPAPQQPADPSSPFDVLPIDQEQDVARIRWLEMRREIASTSYTKQPPEWQQKLLAAYDAARRAAGIATVAEQQHALQQQAQQQAQQKREAQESKQQHEANQSDADRAFTAEQTEAKHRLALEREAMNAQGGTVPRAHNQRMALV